WRSDQSSVAIPRRPDDYYLHFHPVSSLNTAAGPPGGAAATWIGEPHGKTTHPAAAVRGISVVRRRRGGRASAQRRGLLQASGRLGTLAFAFGPAHRDGRSHAGRHGNTAG